MEKTVPIEPTKEMIAAAWDAVDANDVDGVIDNDGALLDAYKAMLAAAPAPSAMWQPIEKAPYATPVLAWLHLPKNPIASALVIAQRCHVQKDDPADWAVNIRQTVGCWWANGRYYDAGHVTHWMPLPTPPSSQ